MALRCQVSPILWIAVEVVQECTSADGMAVLCALLTVIRHVRTFVCYPVGTLKLCASLRNLSEVAFRQVASIGGRLSCSLGFLLTSSSVCQHIGRRNISSSSSNRQFYQTVPELFDPLTWFRTNEQPTEQLHAFGTT